MSNVAIIFSGHSPVEPRALICDGRRCFPLFCLMWYQEIFSEPMCWMSAASPQTKRGTMRSLLFPSCLIAAFSGSVSAVQPMLPFCSLRNQSCVPFGARPALCSRVIVSEMRDTRLFILLLPPGHFMWLPSPRFGCHRPQYTHQRQPGQSSCIGRLSSSSLHCV